MKGILFFMKKVCIILLFLLVFTACSTNEHESNEIFPLAGFIEIRGNVLQITPVEVFILYEGDDIGFQDSFWDAVEFIHRNDIQRMETLGLTMYDFPSWVHIRPNWHSDKQLYYVEQAGIETLSFMITDNTEFTFVDSQLLFDTNPYGNRQRVTNSVDEFMHYFFPSVVHFIEVQNGNIVRLFQDFGFTI